MLMGSKDFNDTPHKWVTDGSGLQDKDLGALFLLRASSRNSSGIYKHKTHNICCEVTITIFTSQDLDIRGFVMCSTIVN